MLIRLFNVGCNYISGPECSDVTIIEIDIEIAIFRKIKWN